MTLFAVKKNFFWKKNIQSEIPTMAEQCNNSSTYRENIKNGEQSKDVPQYIPTKIYHTNVSTHCNPKHQPQWGLTSQPQQTKSSTLPQRWRDRVTVAPHQKTGMIENAPISVCTEGAMLSLKPCLPQWHFQEFSVWLPCNTVLMDGMNDGLSLDPALS